MDKYNFDFWNQTLAWFKSYLCGRRRTTGDSSGFLSIRCDILKSVSQGSGLSLALFILFINDSLDVLHGMKYKMYADDLQVNVSCLLDDLFHILLLVESNVLAVY